MPPSHQLSGNPPPQTATETSRDSPTVRLPRTLRLRGDETPGTNEPSPARHIRWSEDVVDNEGMGKKSSKGDLFSVFSLGTHVAS
ncbi:Type 1 phosphatases regulator ypi1 [Penicillium capsulatum]|nr:Type 1 phosphatases regulator ypi1 [Penicillium capsulatum]